MVDDKKYKIMQLSIEERKIEMLEQESKITMEKLEAEKQDHLNIEKEHLNVEKECMEFKLDILCLRMPMPMVLINTRTKFLKVNHKFLFQQGVFL